MTDEARPNILWITTHDINPDLGCYAGLWPGAEYAQTPNLDQLAAEGVRYDNAFAVAPVCAPSRSAIITRMYPTAMRSGEAGRRSSTRCHVVLVQGRQASGSAPPCHGSSVSITHFLL